MDPVRLAAAVVDPNLLTLVAAADGTLVARAQTPHLDRPDGQAPAGHYLGGIAVVPEFRRRGIATALTQVRLEWIRERDSTAW